MLYRTHLIEDRKMMKKTPAQTCARLDVARALLASSKGTMVGLTFRKKDGTVRRLNGRLGVSRYCRGRSDSNDTAKLVTLYDVKNEGYRMVSLASLTEVRMRGTFYKLEEVAA